MKECVFTLAKTSFTGRSNVFYNGENGFYKGGCLFYFGGSPIYIGGGESKLLGKTGLCCLNLDWEGLSLSLS